MASIFDSLADTTEAPPKPKGTGSIFDDLGEPEAKPAAAPAGEIPRGSLYTAPAAVPQAPPLTAGRVAGKVGEAAVDLVDMAISGVPAMLLGTIGEVTQRLSGLADGRGYREGAKAGAEFSRSMGERFGRPLYDNLKAAGVIKGTETSLPQQAMEKIGGWLEHAATVVEHDSKGVISKEDYLASVNGFMAAMGVKGLKAMTQGALNKVEARGTKNAWDSALERFDAEEQLARQVSKLTTPVADAAKIRLLARQPSEATRTKKQARKDARAAFGTPEAEAQAWLVDRQAGLVDRQAAYREELAAQEAAVRDRFPPSGERTGSRGPVDLALAGKETPTTYGGNQPFHTADTTAALKRGIVADTPIQTEGRLAPVAATPLDSGLVKVKEGRLFDMTMEERLAVRNSVDITDPKVITAAAVGATGLGLAMMYEPSAEEAALAIGAGALLRRGGAGETIRELGARPHATPIGAILEPSAITTSTIELLANRSPGKFEFRKAEIEQLLKREGVTKHERDLMQEALASQPGDTITAKELLFGVRMAAKDFELTPVMSTSYADYGLDRLDRDVLNPELAAELGLDATSDMTATTRIYRSPLELGSNNHFQDPNYFAHTRSFVEDGVRHVVELQSDLAQKAGKVLKPEERAAYTSVLLEARLLEDKLKKSGVVGMYVDNPAWLETFRRDFVSWPQKAQQLIENRVRALSGHDTMAEALQVAAEPDGPGKRIRRDINSAVGDIQERLGVKIAEHEAKLKESASTTAIAPMLKDWHKRLVREELADAARNLEGSVRFATADTVAKVEGWPDVYERIADSIAQNESNLASHKQTVAALEAIKHGEVPDDPYYYALRTADPEGFQSVVKNIETELTHAREALAASEERLARAKENWAGQTRFSKEHQGIYDRYSRDVEKFLRQLGAQPITDSAGHTWLEVPLGEQQKALPGGGARAQIGGVDPALAKAVGAVGGTAALAWMLSRDKDKAKHAVMAGVLTGLGLLAYARNAPLRGIIDQTIHGVQQVAGNLSTDKAVSAPLLRRFTEHARAELKNIHDSGRKISPFLEIANKVPDAARAQLNVALANGRTSDIVAAIGSAATPGLLKEWNAVQLELKAMGTQLKDLGLIKDLRQDYFPRIVKDVPGLLTKLGKEAVPLQRALNAAEKAAGGVLDEAERSAIVNKFLEKNLRSGGVGGKASFFKRRTIDNVTIDLEPFYVEPLQALPLYMASAVRAIEKAKFFGKDAVRDPVTGKLHLESSIGNVVNAEIASGQMSPENFNRLTKLLETRFGPAYAAPARPLRALSQVTNIALLGNVFSGMMNLADIGGIMAQQGILSTVSAVVKKIRGQHKITAADVGMADHIMEEFVYGTREPVRVGVPFSQRTVQLSLAKAVDKTFKFSGFKAFDQAMKEVHLNAAMENYSRMSRSKAGEAKIIRQYGDYFTTDMPQLLADLRSGAKTKLTTELAFRELSDAQPITKIEMPQFYLDHPNLRYGYALKSFAIKQLNLVKKRGVDEIAKGNVRDGMGFLIRYALLAGSAGAGMDWIIKSMLGRDADTDWGVIPFNVLKNIGISEFAIDRARQGKGKEAILMATVPPMDPVLNIVTADPKAMRYFPLVGRFAYDRFMDGAEKANAAKKLAEKKKAADARRTPEERRELERRALERRKALTQ